MRMLLPHAQRHSLSDLVEFASGVNGQRQLFILLKSSLLVCIICHITFQLHTDYA